MGKQKAEEITLEECKQFYKDVYIASLQGGQGGLDSSVAAERAVKRYLEKFKE